MAAFLKKKMARQDTIKQNKICAKYDREELVQLIVCDILNGVSRYRVLLKLKRDLYPDIETSKFSRSKQYDLIQEAYENCKIPLAKERDKMRNLQLARLEDILEECRDQNDRANAVNVIKEMNKLTGIYEPEKVDVTGDIKVNRSFGIEE